MVLIWLYIMRKYLLFEGCGRKKTKKSWWRGSWWGMAAAGDGIGAGMPTEGSGTGQGGQRDGRPGAADRRRNVRKYRRRSWVGCWCRINQRLFTHRFCWCFFMSLQIYFAPLPTLHRWRRLSGGGGDAGGMAGSRAAWRSYTPPLMVYVGTISRFSLQKFFFGFRVALGRCRLAKLLAYIVEYV